MRRAHARVRVVDMPCLEIYKTDPDGRDNQFRYQASTHDHLILDS